MWVTGIGTAGKSIELARGLRSAECGVTPNRWPVSRWEGFAARWRSRLLPHHMSKRIRFFLKLDQFTKVSFVFRWMNCSAMCNFLPKNKNYFVYICIQRDIHIRILSISFFYTYRSYKCIRCLHVRVCKSLYVYWSGSSEVWTNISYTQLCTHCPCRLISD